MSLVAVVTALNLAFGLSDAALVDPDEGRNALITREMATGGEVGACAISGGPYIDHPEVHNGADAIVPVDWESTGVGPGEIDLAMLLENWPEDVVHRCFDAYCEARYGTCTPGPAQRAAFAVGAVRAGRLGAPAYEIDMRTAWWQVLAFLGFAAIAIALVIEGALLADWIPAYFTRGPVIRAWRRRRASPFVLTDSGCPPTYVHEGWLMPMAFRVLSDDLLFFRESWAWDAPSFPVPLRGIAKWDAASQTVVIRARLCMWPFLIACIVAVFFAGPSATLWARIGLGVGTLGLFLLFVPFELRRYRRVADALAESPTAG